MATTLNITTTLKAFLAKTSGRKWQMLGHCDKSDGTTKVQCWYDVDNDIIYADPTFNVAATQNPDTGVTKE